MFTGPIYKTRDIFAFKFPDYSLPGKTSNIQVLMNK